MPWMSLVAVPVLVVVAMALLDCPTGFRHAAAVFFRGDVLACRPMLSLALALMAGVLAGRFFPWLPEWAAYGWLPFGAALALFRYLPPTPEPEPPASLPESYVPHIFARPGGIARRGVNLFLLILCCGSFLLGVSRQGSWARHIVRERLPENRYATVLLEVRGPGPLVQGAGGRWRVKARLLEVNGMPWDGAPIRVYVPEEAPFRRGDLLEGRVRINRAAVKPYPGAIDPAFWLERDGVCGSANILSQKSKGKPSYRVMPVSSPGFVTQVRRAIDAVRGWGINKTLAWGGEWGGMLAAMVYGYRDSMDREVNEAFRRVGIGHVVAISGLHVGLIVGLLWWLGGRMGWHAQWRSRICLILALVYLGISGGQVAAARATLMAVIHLGAIALGRRGDMVNSLGAAAFGIVLYTPSAPLDVSFQLSFTAVVFIYIGLRNWRRRSPQTEPLPRRHPVASTPFLRLRRELVALSLLSLSTSLGLFPIIAAVFNQVNIAGLPLNIIVIPLMSLVLAGGLLLPILGWIPGLGVVLTLPSRLLVWGAVATDGISGSSFAVHAPSGIWMAVLYLFVFLFLLNRMVPPGTVWRRWLIACFLGAGVGLVGMCFSMTSSGVPPGGRLAILPGRGMGVVAAESFDGELALVGQPGRQGLGELGWLHSLKRSGPLSALVVGRSKAESFATLAYHYPLKSFVTVGTTVRALAGQHPTWQPVPGSEGVRYAVFRTAKGRVDAVAVRTGALIACLTFRIATERVPEVFSFLGEESEPGDGRHCVTALHLADRNADPFLFPDAPGVVCVSASLFSERELPVGWRAVGGLGAICLDEMRGIRVFDGTVWRFLGDAGDHAAP